MRLFALAGVIAGLLVTSAPGQKDEERFKIEIASPKPGEKIKVRVEEKCVTTIKILVNGKEEVTSEKKTKSLEYEDEIVASDPTKRTPTNLKRTYKMAMFGTGENNNTDPLVIQGKTVEITGGPDAYKFRIAKKDLDKGPALDLLKTEFGPGSTTDLRDYLVTKNPLKEGEPWKMGAGTERSREVARVLSSNDFQLNAEKATINGKLVAVNKDKERDKKKDKDEPLTGKIEVTFTAPVVQFGLKDSGFVVKEGTLTVTLTGTGCINGKSPAGTLDSVMTLNVSGTSDGYDVNIETIVTEKRTTEKK